MEFRVLKTRKSQLCETTSFIEKRFLTFKRILTFVFLSWKKMLSKLEEFQMSYCERFVYRKLKLFLAHIVSHLDSIEIQKSLMLCHLTCSIKTSVETIAFTKFLAKKLMKINYVPAFHPKQIQQFQCLINIKKTLVDR